MNRERKPNTPQGHVEHRGQPAGAITEEAVEARARELAMLDGRSGVAVTRDDRHNAEMELLNESVAVSTDDDRTDMLASRNPAAPAVETGHKIEDRKPADEQAAMEKEVKEGVREAEHERMVEAHLSKGPSV